MTVDTPRYRDAPFVDSVLCVTDFSMATLHTFAHALAVAMSVRGELILVHANKSDHEDWTYIPGVRAMLEAWGFLNAHSSRSAVFEQLALRVSRIVAEQGKYRAVIDLLAKRSVDLVVVATEEGGWTSRLRASDAERILHSSRTMTLFVPAKGRGFVSLKDGHHTLKNILIPVDSRQDPGPAVTYAIRAAVFSVEDTVHLHVLHVLPANDRSNVLSLQVPADRPYVAFHGMTRIGDPADEILKAADDLDADLIVMSTSGEYGFLDVRGSRVSDQVVRRAPCPVLAVPLGT